MQTVAGLEVRPTSDRLRETLFNILARGIVGARLLDICAGSGVVSLEALSRGAAHATMIENSRRALGVIQENLQTLGIAADAARLINRDALVALSQLERSAVEPFDLVFFDPPYASDLYEPVLTQLADGKLLDRDALVIVEHHAKRALSPDYGRLRRYREVRQGESALAFYGIPLPEE